MEYFDKCQALDVIEDALIATETPHNIGVATGLCGAFYMCGLFSKKEWEELLKRIPIEPCKDRDNKDYGIAGTEVLGRGRVLS